MEHFVIHWLVVYSSVVNLADAVELLPVLHAGDSVLHPLLVVAFGEVVAGVGAATFLPVFSPVYGLRCEQQEVLQLQSFD